MDESIKNSITVQRQQLLNLFAIVLFVMFFLMTTFLTLFGLFVNNQPILWFVDFMSCGGIISTGLSYYFSLNPKHLKMGIWITIGYISIVTTVGIFIYGPSEPTPSAYTTLALLSLYLIDGWATALLCLFYILSSCLLYILPYDPPLHLLRNEATILEVILAIFVFLMPLSLGIFTSIDAKRFAAIRFLLYKEIASDERARIKLLHYIRDMREAKQTRRLLLDSAKISEAAGKVLDAARIYIQVEEFDKAAYLLDKFISNNLNATHTDLQAENNRLIGLIPKSYQQKYPFLYLAQASQEVASGNIKMAISLYETAELMLRSQAQNNYADYAIATAAELALIFWSSDNDVAYYSASCQRISRQLNLEQDYFSEIAKAKSCLVLAALLSLNEKRFSLEEAEQYLIQASTIRKGEGLEIAKINYIYGSLYEACGRYVKANQYYELALFNFSEIVDIAPTIWKVQFLTRLGNNLCTLHTFKKAEEVLLRAWHLSKTIFSPAALSGEIALDIAIMFSSIEKLDEADNFFNESYNLLFSIKHPKAPIMLRLMFKRTINYILLGKKEEATDLIRSVSVLLEEGDDNKHFDRTVSGQVIQNYMNKAWFDILYNNAKLALRNAKKALEQISDEQIVEMAHCQLLLSIIFFSLQNRTKALHHLAIAAEIQNVTDYNLFLPFELKMGSKLFEYICSQPSSASDETHNFLIRNGYQIQLVEKDEIITRPLLLIENYRRNPSFNFPLKLVALDGVHVWNEEVEIESWRINKAAEMLFYLADKNGAEVPVGDLLDTLWGEFEDRGLSVVHNAVSILRKAISPNKIINTRRGFYALDMEHVYYDVTEFEAGIQLSLSQPASSVINTLSQTLELYKRDFLPSIYTEWVIQRQSDLKQTYVKGLRHLAKGYWELKEYQLSIETNQRILKMDSYDEESHQQIIKSLLGLGKKVEAQRQYERCRQILKELNIEPSSTTLKLLA